MSTDVGLAIQAAIERGVRSGREGNSLYMLRRGCELSNNIEKIDGVDHPQRVAPWSGTNRPGLG
jgi:hypothetical protein